MRIKLILKSGKEIELEPEEIQELKNFLQSEKLSYIPYPYKPYTILTLPTLPWRCSGTTTIPC